MTERQKEYLNYATNVIKTEKRTPTYQEIGDHFGVKRATVFNSIGHIAKFKKVRKSKDLCPLCGNRLIDNEGIDTPPTA